jgi:predicted CxxxxCH...CXXCH cytochrome family protein
MKYIRHILVCSLIIFVALMTSCSEDRSTASYKTHSADWNYPPSAEFHGQQAILSASQSCAACHGENFTGGQSGISCYECHSGYPHPAISAGSPAVHANLIAASEWNLSTCQNCHGVDFSGGRTHSSCRDCHVAPAGPAACNTCHGDPPLNDNGVLQGMPSGSYGAHAMHVSEKDYACTECHAAVTSLNHAGALPAEVSFDDAQIAQRPPYPTAYNHLGSPVSGNGNCATYCHSDARGGAPLVAVEWLGAALTACQSCHAVPPASAGHPTERQCHLCHFNVDPNSNYDLPDGILFSEPGRHVNGVVDISLQP